MANVSWGKKLLAIAVACCACAMIAVPAYAFYYVHSDEGVQVESKGVYEVTCVLDETAQGGAIRSELVIVPEGSTVKDLLNEMSCPARTRTALRPFITTTPPAWPITWPASSTRQPCTPPRLRSRHADHARRSGHHGDDTQLNRYDNVVIKVA